jgi:hypothetical protein
MNRATLLKQAGAGSAVAVFPGLFAADALAQAAPGSRIAVWVAFSEAPKKDSVVPRIGMVGAVTFHPDKKTVAGGGSYSLFDQATPVPKTILASGPWTAKTFLSYDQKGLTSWDQIQPGILEFQADFQNLGNGLTLRTVCNVGPAGLMTGEPEGYVLKGTTYGDFLPLNPIVGITHLSVDGYTTEVTVVKKVKVKAKCPPKKKKKKP